MLSFRRSPSSWLLSAAVLLSLLAACGTRSAQNPPLVVKQTSYQAPSALPSRYEGIQGVALFDVSAGLGGLLAGLTTPPPAFNSFFILLNPRKPTEGILVCAGPNLQDGVIQAQSSRSVQITGNVRTMADNTVATFVEETYGISLARDARGATAWIENEVALTLEPVPVAASPAVQPPADAPAASPAAQPPADAPTAQPTEQGDQ